MRCNFCEDYRSVNRFDSDDFGVICGAYAAVTLFLLFLRFIIEAICFNLESSFGSMVAFSSIGGVVALLGGAFAWSIYCYYKERDNTYSLFRVRDLKKWYALNPERFVFNTEGSVVYYIHNEQSVAKNSYRVNGFNKHLDTTRMYPKTLIEALKYSCFVDGVFNAMEKEEKSQANHAADIQKQKDIIYANNEMVRVMGSIQKDIDRVLVESQQIIADETLKMEQLNHSV